MLLTATLVKRGLADRTFSEDLGTIEREHGRRNALVRTPEGELFHIHDRQFRQPYASDLVPGLGRSSRGPRAYPPRQTGQVIIETRGASRSHGQHLEARAWTLLPDYRKALQLTFAQGGLVTMRPQPSLVKIIMKFMDQNYSPTEPEEWVAFEELMHQLQSRHGVDPGYMQFLKSYYLLGRTRDECMQFIRQTAPS